jgi:hypothetical protein
LAFPSLSDPSVSKHSYEVDGIVAISPRGRGGVGGRAAILESNTAIAMADTPLRH